MITAADFFYQHLIEGEVVNFPLPTIAQWIGLELAIIMEGKGLAAGRSDSGHFERQTVRCSTKGIYHRGNIDRFDNLSGIVKIAQVQKELGNFREGIAKTPVKDDFTAQSADIVFLGKRIDDAQIPGFKSPGGYIGQVDAGLFPGDSAYLRLKKIGAPG